MKKAALGIITFAIFLLGLNSNLWGQAELQAWGNLNGIRMDGQLMKFETSILVAKNNWQKQIRTGKEKQSRPIYKREGNQQIVTTRIDSIRITKVVKDEEKGTASVDVRIESGADSLVTGIFFSLRVPGQDYRNGRVQLINPSDLALGHAIPSSEHEFMRMSASGFKILSESRHLEVRFQEPTYIIAKKLGDHIEFNLEIAAGSVQSGQVIEKSYSITASGKINRDPVTLIVDPSQPGRAFDGIGGNFRIQNPEMDPPVIDYCLKNLRVSWARVDMPWFRWHPVDSIDPIKEAKNGNLHPQVKRAMQMAQKLDRIGIPVMLAAWFPPRWAALGEFQFRPKPGQPRGNALNPDQMDKIYASITDYIMYLQEEYGVETHYFSFNESDLGINVRQTDKEHTQLIKGLGAYFKSKGLKTKLLLGDTADANGWPFINDAMEDPEARTFMGPVSFHSWRGWETETLQKWRDASLKMDIPLIVGEGSIDAAAWRYPGIFEEQTYALEEINLYIRIMAICQPLTILQWQLTADYSPLSGGGVFGNRKEPLHPTQRFWNLKQLGSTKKGLKYLPISHDGKDLSCAALGDNQSNDLAIHLVNNGPARQVIIKGLPSKIKRLDVWTTSSIKNMEKGAKIKVKKGEAVFTMDAVSFASLMTK